MKKYFLFFGLIVINGLLSVRIAYGQGGGYFIITAGYPGKMNDVDKINAYTDYDFFSLGGEAGGKWNHILLGIGAAQIFSETDWTVTHGSGSYYTRVDQYNRHVKEIEMFGVIGVPVSKGLTLKCTAGYSGEIVQFKSWSYTNGFWEFPPEDGDGHFSFSGQLQLGSKGFLFDIGYHNRRGLIAGVGINFPGKRR
jgi:hypothetical protein